MNNQTNRPFGEKEQATDLLMTEKLMASTYNTFLLESATPEVLRSLHELLNDTYAMQQRLFQEMNSRGWYPVTRAQNTKLSSEKQKFEAKVSQ